MLRPPLAGDDVDAADPSAFFFVPEAKVPGGCWEVPPASSGELSAGGGGGEGVVVMVVLLLFSWGSTRTEPGSAPRSLLQVMRCFFLLLMVEFRMVEAGGNELDKGGDDGQKAGGEAEVARCDGVIRSHCRRRRCRPRSCL